MNSNKKFEDVLKNNKDRIYRICCAYVRDADEREDLFQEIMINIWKNLDKFEGRSLISTWVYRIAVNTSLMHVKSAGRRGKVFTSLDELSYKEIAEITGMTVTNIGVKITRIKKELAAMMEPPSID